MLKRMALFRQIVFVTFIAVAVVMMRAEDETNPSGLTLPIPHYRRPDPGIYGHKNVLTMNALAVSVGRMSVQ
jgi:hypothetical protein